MTKQPIDKRVQAFMDKLDAKVFNHPVLGSDKLKVKHLIGAAAGGLGLYMVGKADMVEGYIPNPAGVAVFAGGTLGMLSTPGDADRTILNTFVTSAAKFVNKAAAKIKRYNAKGDVVSETPLGQYKYVKKDFHKPSQER